MISHVVVYLDRARVSQTICVESLANPISIQVNEIDPNSIQVSGIHVLDVQYIQGSVEHVAVDLTLEKEALELLGLKKQAAQSTLALIETFTQQVLVVPTLNEDKPLDWNRVNQFLNSTAKTRSETHRNLSVEVLELTKQSIELEAKISRLEAEQRKAGIKTESRIVILAKSDEAVEKESPITFQVSYLTRSACWKPSYNVRVSNQTQMELVYSAEVSQWTGQDWDNVGLIVSTARPSVPGKIPKFTQQWRLDVEPEIQFQVKTKGLMMAMAFAPRMEEGCGPPGESEIEIPQSKVVQSISSATYEIPHRASIPSDSSSHKVSIATLKMNPVFEHVAIPKNNPKAYLKATSINDTLFTLIPGPMSVYVDGDFVAKAPLEKTISPSESFHVSLGVDPSVAIHYLPIKKASSETGISLMGKTKVLKYTQTIRIKNNKLVPLKLSLMDQIPYSVQDKVKVTLLEPLPSSLLTIPSTIDRGSDTKTRFMTDLNLLDFMVELEAGQETERVIRYEVSSPESESVRGL